MKLRAFLTLIVCGVCTLATAVNYKTNEPLKLEVPEMKAELVNIPETEVLTLDMKMPEASPKMDFDFFKSKTNPGVKPYKFMDDMTFVGVPLFVAGMLIKGDKAMFRVNNKDGKKNTQLLTDFKTGIDDYTQYFGPALTVGLKLGGYEGRSDWPRLLASAAMSYGLMAILVNTIKYTAKEMRPDGSQANSWPSGHTATSFVGATMLHKEYGLTRSPWFSVAGYGVATATGVMRVLNNRHWVSDVMSGAGIGILSTELGYAFSDLLFKGKGLLRNDLEMDFENPSFFSISMGVGLGGKDIGFSINDLQDREKYGIMEIADADVSEEERIQFRAATVVDAEGAYFFNKYVGVGGRLRVRAMSAKSFGQYNYISTDDPTEYWATVVEPVYDAAQMTFPTESLSEGGLPVTDLTGTVKSDHLAEFTVSGGLYFNIPLSKRFAIGTKLLVGRSFTQELDIDGHAEGNVKDIPYELWISNGKIHEEEGIRWFVLDDPKSTGEKYSVDWDYLTLGAKSSTSWGTGISLTYKYKSNFSWRVFCDYDYTEKTFTLTGDTFNFMKDAVTPSTYDLLSTSIVSPYYMLLDPIVYKKKKKMNYFTIGLSFLVNL
ncbi:MAG: phosphatase PAP2 family protein [Prevotella sp.]|nr:phosphatase PAP2 family protein [Prevotella sp.]